MKIEKKPLDRRSHTPLIPQQEIQTDLQAMLLFLPMAAKYLARHLTIGTVIRIRRVILRKLNRVYYV